jgi:N-acetylglucosamine kinase-like BadF-type ATPase
MRRSIDPLGEVVDAACREAGLSSDAGPVALVGVYCLAGADFPIDERRIGRALTRRAWTQRTVVRNDTFAILRAGTDRGWGVAVACGSGLNCLGIGPHGRVVRFPALGELSGDFAAGGEWVGIRALGSAIRARDGRGARTSLERLVPDHFGMARPETVMNAIYLGRVSDDRLVELPPVVFEAATSGDAVAREILDQLADEVVAMAAATIRRLRLAGQGVDAVLGGGVFRAEDPIFVGRIEEGIHAVAPAAKVVVLRTPPIVGAALLGLDEIGASSAASSKLRASVDHATIGDAKDGMVPLDRPSEGV